MKIAYRLLFAIVSFALATVAGAGGFWWWDRYVADVFPFDEPFFRYVGSPGRGGTRGCLSLVGRRGQA